MSSTKNIWVAAGDGDLARVQHLIEHESVSPNAPDEHTYSPMHAAASYGQLHVLEYLIAKGGDVNLEDGDRDTPLYTVENIETARFLVAHGATIDHRNSEGVSPIEHLQDEFSDVASYLHSVASPSSLPLPVFQQPSQRSQNLASEELTSALMASVAEILQRAEEEGRDPDEELKALVGETIMEGLELGYNMSEMIEEERRDEMDPTPTKRAKN